MNKRVKFCLGIFMLCLMFSFISCKGLYGKEKYKIEFVTNGGNSIDAIEVDWGNNFNLPEDPTKEGYDFKGWFLDKKLSDKFLIDDYKVEKNITLYASWEINEYKIEFDTCGGSKIESKTYKYKSQVSVDNPTKEGYLFDGWYLDNNFKSRFDMITPAKDITIFAKWSSYNVAIVFDKNANDATGNMDIQTIAFDSQNKALSPNKFERTGYTFKGWALSNDGSVTFKDQAVYNDITENKNITLYAIWEENLYDVVFVSNNIQYDKKQGKYKSNIIYPENNPKMTGYTFKGWGYYVQTNDKRFNGAKIYYKNTGTELEPVYSVAQAITNEQIDGKYYELQDYTEKLIPLNGLTLYAIFNRNQYKVSYVIDDTNINEDYCYYNDRLKSPTNPEKLGYTFVGWYENSDLSGLEFVFNKMPANNLKLYAKWEINSYTITFESKGGTELTSLTDEYNSDITKPSDPEKLGYTFKGWYENSDLSGTAFVFNKMPANNVVLYAKWIANTNTSYFVEHYTEDLNKTTAELAGTYSLNSKETLTGITEELTNASYKSITGFIGKGVITQQEIKGDGTTVIKLYYTRNKYQVKFIDESETLLATEEVYYEASIITMPTFTRTGYSYELKDYNGNEFSNNTVILSNMDVSVIYIANTYTIKLNAYSVTENPTIGDIKADYGTEITLPTPIKTGYTFKGWYNNSSYTGDAYTLTTMPAENVDLYAKWEINSYTITFESNGGTEVTPLTDEYNSDVTKPSDPEKLGYTFVGWYENSDLSGLEFVFNKMPANNLKLYAKWEINSYTITFDSKGGTELTSLTDEYNSDITKPSDPEKLGYTFKGWYENSDLSGTAFVFNKMPSNNVVLYAKWIANTNTSYFVEHYTEDLNKTTAELAGTYSLNSKETLTGITEELTNASYKSITGFIGKGVITQEEIKGDGTTVIKLYYTRNKYQVKFIDENETLLGTEEVYYEASIITMPNYLVKTGYSYELKDINDNTFGANIQIMDDMDIKVLYTLKTLDISFYSYPVNENPTIKSIEADYGTEIILPTPIKTGYTFKGWYNNSSYTGDAYTLTTMPAENVDLYAKWEINSYTITFESNGGTEVTPLTDEYNSDVTKPSDPEKLGYTFVGWYENSDLSGLEFVFNKMPANNFKLYAKWEINSYTITFESKGGTELTSLTDEYNSDITKPSDPEKLGYTFKGWYENSDLSGTAFVFNKMPANNVVLYAKWIANTNTSYFVEHYTEDLNKTTAELAGTYSLNSKETLTGITEELTNASYKSITGFIGKGVITQQEIKGDGTTVIKLYYTRNKYQVKFIDESETLLATEEVYYEASIITMPTFTRTGYSYELKDYNGNEFSNNTVILSNMDVSVIYIANTYTIKLNAYSVTENPTIGDIKADYGTEITLPTPIKTGYTFKGWYNNSSYTGDAYTLTTMPAENVDLYAKWEINSYTITFESNGGTEVTPLTDEYNSDVTKPSDPEKLGYTFVGWYENSDLSGLEFVFNKMPANNLKLYAKWEINSYTITFDSKGGTELTSLTDEYNSDITKPSDPEKLGYTFKGWYENSDLSGTAFVFNKMPANNVVLYAKWEINSYTLTFNVSNEQYKQFKINYGDPINFTSVPDSYSDLSYFYIFSGWMENSTLVNLPKTMPAEDKTYDAKFNKYEYTVNYLNNLDGTIIWSAKANGKEIDFIQYIEEIYNQMNAYDYIDQAIEDMIKGSSLGDTSLQQKLKGIISYITFVLNYDTNLNTFKENIFSAVLSNAGITQEAYNSMADTDESKIAINSAYNIELDKYITNDRLNAAGLVALSSSNSITIDIDTATAIIKHVDVIDAKGEKEYLTLFTNFTNDQETPKNQTSLKHTEIRTIYNQYKSNAYNPVRIDGAIFDGWKMIDNLLDYENCMKNFYAKWIYKLSCPQNIRIKAITSTSITIIWDIVENCYGYRVIVNINGVVRNFEDIITNELLIENIKNGDSIEISIIALNRDSDGNLREESNQYSVESFEGAILLKEAVSINSDESIVFNYKHNISSDQSISSSGDYFYIGDSGKLYLFTNTSYKFNDVSFIEILEGNEYVEFDGEALNTKSLNGNISFVIYKKANGTAISNETYYECNSGTYQEVEVNIGDDVSNYYTSKTIDASISLLVDSIDLGDNLYSYNNQNNDSTYLNENLAAYLIGCSSDTSDYSDYGSYTYNNKTYYNGFKFDINVVTTSGLLIDSSLFDLYYQFYKENDSNVYEIVTDTSSLYVYDTDNDVFYFLNDTGKYRVDISYKKDGYYKTLDNTFENGKLYYELINEQYIVTTDTEFNSNKTYYENYINLTIPNTCKSLEMNTSFTFELNNGINVYTDDGLKSAYSNKTASCINIHSNISAELTANQVGFMEYMKTNNLCGANSLNNGEVDIVNNTAIMCTDTKYGPKCWTELTNVPTDGTFYFISKDNKYYKYDINGSYVIMDAKWEPNYTSGHFKLCNGYSYQIDNYRSYNLELSSIYQRTDTNKETNDCSSITINGNYFTIDGTKLPYIISSNHISSGSAIATYEIQAVYTSILANYSESKTTINNLTILGNTKDASAFLNSNSGETDSIAEYMSRTSGGYIGVMSINKNGSWVKTTVPETTNSIDATNLNVYNTLIGAYAMWGSSIKLDYCNFRQTWANSVYADGGNMIDITNCKIESSGGAAIHIQDLYYTLPSSLESTNPNLTIDLDITSIENYISGEEQWFKAYSMEVLALGMKTTLDKSCTAINSAMGSNYTVIKQIKDPQTGLISEKMNFVFLTNNNYNSATDENYKDDIMVNINISGASVISVDANGTKIYTVNKKAYLYFESVQASKKICGIVELFNK